MRFISTVRWSCAITSTHLSNRTVFVLLCCWCVVEPNSMHLNGVFGVLPNSRIVFQFNAKADTHTARLPSQIDLEDFSVFIRRTLINDRSIKIQNHWHIIPCTGAGLRSIVRFSIEKSSFLLNVAPIAACFVCSNLYFIGFFFQFRYSTTLDWFNKRFFFISSF